jgi:tetratricopeptide (TPR) repeat protein
VVAFFCFALSMLTKPTSCLLPPALLVFDYWRRRDWNAESIVAWAALFAAAAVGGAIAFVSQRNSLGEAPLDALTDRIDTIIVICHNIVFYLRLFVAPVSLSTHHPIPFEITLSDPAMLAGVIGTFAVGVSLVTAWRLNRRGWLFGLIGFLILLAPVLGAVRFMSEIAADRFLYLPMLPILMAIVTWAGFKLGRLRAAGRGVTPLSGRVGLGAAVLMLALFTLKTLTQQSAWRDSFAFWNAAIAYQADVSSSIFGLGTAYMERAESRLKAARALDGQDAPDSVKTTTAYQRDIDDALRLFQRALELPGYDARAAMEIAAIYADRGQFQEALDLLAENVPENSVTRREFALKGFILTNLGRHEEAIAAYERFLRLRPRDPGVLLNLGNALLRVGRIEEAERRLESRVEMDRNDVDDGRAWYTLGLARLRLRGDAAAIEPLEHAVRLCPGNADFQFALSARYAGVGRDREALGALAVAIRRDASKADIARKAPQFERLRGTTAWRGLIPEQPRDGT